MLRIPALAVCSNAIGVLTYCYLVSVQYDGDFRAKLDDVRAQLNAVAEGWTREEKDSCLEETDKSFKYSGGLLRTITAS